MKLLLEIDGIEYPLDCIVISEEVFSTVISYLIFQSHGGLHFANTGVCYVVKRGTGKIIDSYRKSPTVTTRYRPVSFEDLSSGLLNEILSRYFKEEMI